MTTWIRVQKGSTSAKTHDPQGRSSAYERSKNPTRAPGRAYPHARGCCMLTKSSFSRAKNSRSSTLVAAANVIVVVRLPLRRHQGRPIDRARIESNDEREESCREP